MIERRVNWEEGRNQRKKMIQQTDSDGKIKIEKKKVCALGSGGGRTDIFMDLFKRWYLDKNEHWNG